MKTDSWKIRGSCSLSPITCIVGALCLLNGKDWGITMKTSPFQKAIWHGHYNHLFSVFSFQNGAILLSSVRAEGVKEKSIMLVPSSWQLFDLVSWSLDNSWEKYSKKNIYRMQQKNQSSLSASLPCLLSDFPQVCFVPVESHFLPPEMKIEILGR